MSTQTTSPALYVGTYHKYNAGSLKGAWLKLDDYADQARALVAGPAERRAPRAGRYQSTVTRFSSGAEVYTNRRGRCEDAPCCGCCS